MPAQRGKGLTRSEDTSARRGAARGTHYDDPMRAYRGASAASRLQQSHSGRTTDAPTVPLHISVQPRGGETVCVVEGVIDASSASDLAGKLEVALGVQPDNTVLLDLSQVSWMSLLDVRAVVDTARRKHPHRLIIGT